MWKSSRLVLLLAVPGLVAAACGDDDEGGAGGDITVFAATSLTEALSDAGEAFAAAHEGSSIEFSFDASSALVTQITEGAPADVFASADVPTMDKLTDAGLNGSDPVVFATNLLTIIVPAGNPGGVTGVEDLAKPDLTVVLCAEEVPCGNYANQILEAAGVQVTPASFEENVRGVVTKVTSGEADAGIVYVTDAIGAGDNVAAVAFPEAAGAVNTYPIAVLKGSKNPQLARKFVDLVTGDSGQKVLNAAGFTKP